MPDTFARHLYADTSTDPGRLCVCGRVSRRDYDLLWHQAGAPRLNYDGMTTCDPVAGAESRRPPETTAGLGGAAGGSQKPAPAEKE